MQIVPKQFYFLRGVIMEYFVNPIYFDLKINTKYMKTVKIIWLPLALLGFFALNILFEHGFRNDWSNEDDNFTYEKNVITSKNNNELLRKFEAPEMQATNKKIPCASINPFSSNSIECEEIDDFYDLSNYITNPLVLNHEADVESILSSANYAQ
jgi:hypothetical protein